MSGAVSTATLSMSNNSMSNNLTSNYLLLTIRSFEIERFDIEQRESGEGQAETMDAVTNFELEAERRRETVISDRDLAWAIASASTEPIGTTVETVVVRVPVPAHAPAQGDCQPASLARQSVG
jgi:hypothetical protein